MSDDGNGTLGEDGSGTVAIEQPKPLKFQRSFQKKQGAGTVILQGDDDSGLCFYFRLPNLAALSSFFADLPPPSASDMVDEVPLIPLHDTSASTLFISLTVISSLTPPAPLSLRQRPQMITLNHEAYAKTAVFAKMYDLPILYRMVIDAAASNYRFEASGSHAYLAFTVWAISGVEKQIKIAAAGTIGHDITEAPKAFIAALRDHAPDALHKLQDLHLRRPHAVGRFNRIYAEDVNGGCQECLDKDDDFEMEVHERFEEAKTIEEIEVIAATHFGLSCWKCVQAFRIDYEPKMTWFGQFVSVYGFDKEYEDFLPWVASQLVGYRR